MKILRIKAAAEALHHPHSLQDGEKSPWSLLSDLCFGNDLLDHLGRFLLNGFKILYEVLPRCIGPRARSTCGAESLERCRELRLRKQRVGRSRKRFLNNDFETQ